MGQRERKRRLNYTNVVGTLALFGVIAGGTAVALPGVRLVTSDDFGRDSVRARAIAAGAVRGSEVREGAIRAVDVADDTLASRDLADESLGYPHLGSNSVVARIRGDTPTSTGDGGSANPVVMPVTGNTWTQGADEIDVFFGEVTVTGPATCTGGGGPFGSLMVTLAIGGTIRFGSLLGVGATTETVDFLAGPGGPFGDNRPWLFEPGAATPRTASIEIHDYCMNAGEDFTVNSVKVNAVAMR
jgi:hypothetical protein